MNSERPTKLEARQRQSLPTPSWMSQSRNKEGNTYKKHTDQKNRTKTKDKEKTVLFSDDTIIYAQDPKITAKDFLEHGGHRI